jgi:opacity protein-like surface antigen
MLRFLAISLFAVILTGCASSAQVPNMTVADAQAKANTYDAQLQSNVQLSEVAGGQKTNPLWTSEVDGPDFRAALQQSLKHADLLGGDSATYALRADLQSLDQPLFGLDFEVTSQVEYTLVEVATNKVILREVIRAPFTAGVGDAFYGVKRLRLANEGSARANIEAFLKRLSALKLDAKQITVQ